MGGATNVAENLILDAILGDDKGLAMPDTVYVGLFTSAPTDGGGGTEVTSIGTSYARVPVDNDSANWPAASGGIKQNGILIQFPTATATWGTIAYFGIFDDAMTGNLLIWGEIASPITPLTGNAPFFDTAGLSVVCD